MKKLSILTMLLLCTLLGSAKEITIKSPNGRLSVTVSVDKGISYSVKHDADVMLAPSKIAMELADGTVWGSNPSLSKQSVKNVSSQINAPFYKKKVIDDSYTLLSIAFKGGFALEFRAYNEGAAYRFLSTVAKPYEVKNEVAQLNFSADNEAYVPYVNARATDEHPTHEMQLYNSFENTYTHASFSKLDSRKLSFLPVLVDAGNGKKVCITEADLEDYPGMYVYTNGANGFNTYFAAYPKTEVQGGHNMLQMVVKDRESFIAKVAGPRSFPWRIIAVSENDAMLANNDMVYRLASPSRFSDVSWIKPGKVAWDWWNDWGVYGVDFKAGVNTDTYKHYIDFASKYGVEYVILDEGWSVNLAADLFQVVPEIDLKEILAYAAKKNVGIILWAGYKAFDKDMENICRHYSEMGVKGFKIDFMDRDDQKMVQFYYKAAEVCAKYRMLVDFHGAYKPTGLQRTYPNVLNFEGVHGLEQMKWSPTTVDQISYDVTIPFIRMVAGPMDYTQGAMRNAADKYQPSFSEPMSQGTRCRQLALYVILESPLNMMCDSPDNYDREPECAKFIAGIPVVWDETVALKGKVGEYLAMARRSGDKWYIGALTNKSGRELTLDLSAILKGGCYSVEVFKDGVNADKFGRDYKREVVALPAEKQLNLTLAPGGGYVAIVSAR